MTEEQIKQNAYDYTYTNDHNWTWDDSGESRVDISAEISDAYIAGAHSRDEEIEKLLKHDALENKMRIDLINECEQLKQELNQLRNPWISVEERLPEEGGRFKGYSEKLLVHVEAPQGSYYDMSEYDTRKKAWLIEGFHHHRVTHWMPIPELQKGE